MELWDSIVRLTWDPDGSALVLVDYGDPMWSPVDVDGEQVVQEAQFVRGAGKKYFGRENESHRLGFTLARVTEGVEEAFIARLAAAASLPKSGSYPVLLSFQSGPQFRFADCAVRSWPHQQEEALTRESVEILAGRMTADAGVYVPGQTWGEINFEWENLG